MQIGILGAGQLGRMLALTGIPLGLRFRFWSTAAEAPAGVLGECVRGAFEDIAVMERFVAGLDVVTYEFENVPADTARFLSRHVPVYPPPRILEIAQDRLLEKTLFQQLGIPVPPFAPIQDAVEFEKELRAIGLPAVLKTRRFGYDGKGQSVLRDAADVERIRPTLGKVPMLLERFVPFERELSILAVRGRGGEAVFYPLVENVHRDGILRQSLAPAPSATPELQRRAEDYARRILETVEYVGVLAVEFFLEHGELLANEMAPRVHNSGHWTIEGAPTSQFANHIRAILGLPLGATTEPSYSAMLNLIGSTPPLDALLAIPGLQVHLYGKSPRQGRKMGHLTLTDPSRDSLEARLGELRDRDDLPGIW